MFSKYSRALAVAALVAASALVGGSVAATSAVAADAAAAPSSTSGTDDVPAIDLGDDMREVPGIDLADDATAVPKSPAHTRSASVPTTQHLVYVSVANVTSTASDNTFSTAALSDANITSAIASLSAYWSTETGGAVTFALAPNGIERVNLGASSCNDDTVFSSQATNAFKGRFKNYSWIGSNTHLLTLTQESCDQAAFGTVGGRGGMIFDANSIGQPISLPILYHEFGHNLGLGHADVAICKSANVDAAITSFGYDESDLCPTEQYGDTLDIMGYSLASYAPHLSAIEKIQFGWLAGGYTDIGGSVTTAASTTTTIQSLGASSGTRALRITDPASGAIYVVEYRTATGVDASSPDFDPNYRSTETHGSYTQYFRDADRTTGAVRILRELPFPDDAGLGTDRDYTETVALGVGVVGTNPMARHSWLNAGQTFSAYSGSLRVTVEAASPDTGATLTVSTGPAPTPPAAPAAAVSTPTPAPTTASVAAAPVVVPAPVVAQVVPPIVPPVVTIAPKASKVKLTLSKKRVARGSKLKATVRVTVRGISSPTGKVVAYAGKKALKTYRLKAGAHGKLVIVLPKFAKKGTQKISVVYVGSTTVESATTARYSLRVV